jgi:dGTPase
VDEIDGGPTIDLRRYHDREHLLLASYATHSCDTTGRQHYEPNHPYRGPFARDRDRILHSSAFRRLSGKMQVFTGEMGIYHRTRLTHTFEVASIARTIARALRLNEDLTEALALMHDIGHPPYGHCGEDVLDECLSQDGGFSHNRFALIIVQQLEKRYQAFDGLNLCMETLGGQDVRANKEAAAIGQSPNLEVQIVDAADSIAYDAHDVDDALQLGLLSIDELSELSIVQRAIKSAQTRHATLSISQLRPVMVHELIDLQVSDFLRESENQLLTHEGKSSEELSDLGLRLHHSQTIAKERTELEGFLFNAVYRHERLLPVREAAANRLMVLFDKLVERPERLPLRFRQRSDSYSPRIATGEYLAGMTDVFCDRQYQQITSLAAGPLADW